ncbi:hypothetical protein [Deinococcus roseus]|uniref:Uncharacterized protein n=1 Tax=Deinococcus roseus TaxID=392414 RepID=A0ABQ2DE65_9DEIO|nr:hypothetical protein [Deinococcus roseus]GGJ54829.1 hypothetical protein GCM10008938_46110 [Deinococcus roseus]
MTLSRLPETATDWLEVLNGSLPKRIFVQEVEQDFSQLAQISRVLLCLPEEVLHEQLGHIPRLLKAVQALLHSPIWLDTLMRNPSLLISSLPLLRLYRRSGGPRMEQVLEPIHRLLAWNYIQDSEWMPPYLLEVSVSMQELGFSGFDVFDVEAAYDSTVLPVHVPAWMWCYEKTSVLDYLLKVASTARLQVPQHWQVTCTAELLASLNGQALKPLSSALLHYALTSGTDSRLYQQAIQKAVQLRPASVWDAASSSADLAIALIRKEMFYV